MRLALLLALVAASSARAQPTASPRATPPPAGHRIVLVATAVGGTALALVAGPAAPLATAPVVYGTGYALGHDAPFGRVVVDWTLGAGVGLATYHGLRLVAFSANGGELDLTQDLGAAAAGLAVSAVVTAWLYEGDVPAGPAVGLVPVTMRAESGRRVAGLSLRVGL